MIWRMIEGEEQFVPNALVLLFHGEPGEDNPPIREGHSNEEGWYSFGELAPSGELPYVVVAKKWYGEVLWQGLEDFHLAPGEEKNVCVQIFPPEPPPNNGSVCGMIWRMIEGEEQFVPNALVLLFHGEPGEDNPPIREGHSNEEGYYCFEELAPSGELPYVVVAKKWYGEVLWHGLEDFYLAPGEEKQVCVQIFPPEPPDGTIGGRIYRENQENPDGPPLIVPGATVKLYHGNPEENDPLKTTESNEQGVYHFFDLPPSGDTPYYVVAHKWIEEIYFYGIEDTYLEEDDFVELNVWIWPED
jgi:hypothetical protein